MAFTGNYFTKYDQLDRFAKQQVERNAGESSRARTKKMIGLGSSQAEQTMANAERSAAGVRRIFQASDIGASRPEKKTDPNLGMASWVQAIEEESKESARDMETKKAPEGSVSYVDFDEGLIQHAMGALADVESSDNYNKLGPVVKSGMYKGQRAYGKYQVMAGNVGPWTEKYYGKRLTPQQFLANPEAQDTVVENLLMLNFEKYGTIEDAVSVWFTGRPISEESKKASDSFITGAEYLNRWNKSFTKRRDAELGDME